MSVKFESQRTLRRRRTVVGAILQTQRFVTAAQVLHLMRSMGFAPSDGAVASVLELLRTEHGWVSWRLAAQTKGYHAPDVTEEEERVIRLQMGYVTPAGRRWKGTTYKGWSDVCDYIHRAAKKCGVVTGFDWEHFGYPSLRRFA